MSSIINISHLELRRNLGILGVTYPFILVIGNRFVIEKSLSAYYYTNMGVYFTGVLIAFGLFLFSYKGYEKTNEKISDNLITNIAGIMAIITAFIPGVCTADICCAPNWHQSKLLGDIHFATATIFFFISAWMSYFRFTKRKDDESVLSAAQVKLKNRRNTIYRVCGIGMAATLLILGIVYLAGYNITGKDIFVGEAIAIAFFGTSWLVKAKALRSVGL